MADTQGRLTFVLDENSGGLLHLLRQARAVAHEDLIDLRELGIPAGTLDPDLLVKLGRHARPVLVTRDGSMLEPVIQRGAWRDGGVMLFLMGKAWGKLPLAELTRRAMFLWPSLVAQAEASAAGAAWRVSPTIPATSGNAFRLVTGQHAAIS
ncbi:PIN-like domain-containing protein [Pseudoroseomonas sp. WGS1072]|uniref:PIN-like domain-containing protein n=1 Tax=Roseomonas sp. WGS1072 TaxID=3366816 RepID=UPI003BF17F49